MRFKGKSSKKSNIRNFPENYVRDKNGAIIITNTSNRKARYKGACYKYDIQLDDRTNVIVFPLNKEYKAYKTGDIRHKYKKGEITPDNFVTEENGEQRITENCEYLYKMLIKNMTFSKVASQIGIPSAQYDFAYVQEPDIEGESNYAMLSVNFLDLFSELIEASDDYDNNWENAERLIQKVIASKGGSNKKEMSITAEKANILNYIMGKIDKLNYGIINRLGKRTLSPLFDHQDALDRNKENGYFSFERIPCAGDTDFTKVAEEYISTINLDQAFTEVQEKGIFIPEERKEQWNKNISYNKELMGKSVEIERSKTKQLDDTDQR